MSVIDWRRDKSERLSRDVDEIRDELEGAEVLEVSEYGYSLLLLLKSGERVWYGASGYEFDMEIRAHRET